MNIKLHRKIIAVQLEICVNVQHTNKVFKRVKILTVFKILYGSKKAKAFQLLLLFV